MAEWRGATNRRHHDSLFSGKITIYKLSHFPCGNGLIFPRSCHFSHRQNQFASGRKALTEGVSGFSRRCGGLILGSPPVAHVWVRVAAKGSNNTGAWSDPALVTVP